MEHFGKIIIILTIFTKNLILSYWEGSEYVLRFKYGRALNICKFFLIWQGPEYTQGCNYGSVLNIPGFQMYQVSAYASIAQGSEYAWIWLSNAQ